MPSARAIRQIALKLLFRCQITRPPVNVFAVASLLGLKVHPSAARDGLSGFVMRQPGSPGALIGVNSRHHDNRQRFTIAHEIGHFLLHTGDKYPVHLDEAYFQIRLRDEASGKGDNKEEIEANIFAAELLMPIEFVRKELAEYDGHDSFDDDTLRRLANKFGVSQQALTYRLINLGYISGLA